MEKPSDFGIGLRELRLQRRWSVRELAKQSGVSSVWITLVENGHRSIGLEAVEKLAAGFGLMEPERTEFRLSGLAASGRSELLKDSRKFGPTLNNALAMFLCRLGIRPRDIAEVTSQPTVGTNDLVQLAAALEERARCYQPGDRNAGTRSDDGPFLEIRFKNGQRAWFEMLLTDHPTDDSRTGAALGAARNPPRPLTRATGSRRSRSTLHDQEKQR